MKVIKKSLIIKQAEISGYTASLRQSLIVSNQNTASIAKLRPTKYGIKSNPLHVAKEKKTTRMVKSKEKKNSCGTTAGPIFE